MRRKSWNYLFGVIILVLVLTMKNVPGISCEIFNKDFFFGKAYMTL